MEPQSSVPGTSMIERIFLTPGKTHLRMGWRILVHTIVYNLLLVCIALPTYLILGFTSISPDALWLSVTIQLVTVTPTVFLARRFIDRRSVRSLGLTWNRLAIFDLLAGSIISFLMMGLIFLVESGLGWLTFEGFSWQTESTSSMVLLTSAMVILFILVSWNEEILFRGYRLINLMDGLPSSLAVLLSSAWFGLVHLANPNATWVSAAGILLAGIFMAIPVIKTGQLWMAIGMHFGWNLFEGPIFGFPVSGLHTFTLTKISVTGPEILTGGAFGPEAGLVLLPAVLIGIVLTFIYIRIRPKFIIVK